MQKYIILIIFSSLSFTNEGCTDLFALNYDSDATIDNNSCEYADHIIEAGNYYYSPENLTIEVGESVQWNNLSGYHDVVVTSGPVNIDIAPVSGPALIGSYTFTVPGTYEYICSIGSHANLGMVGTITVNGQCSQGYTFIDDFPQNTCIPLDGSNCFNTQDIEALQDIADLNELELANPLYLGFQNWSSGRITRLLAGNNSNGGFITLNQLPTSIGNLDGLIQLYIDDNELTSLPDEIGNLSNLVYLIANFNSITALPESIGNLSNLNFLDLGYNQISYIPESIGNLSNLQYLWIFDNQLSTLPDSICNLNLDWDGFTQGVSVVPYFGCGGNLLCDNELIPECVENSANFEISLDAAYYLFSVVHEQVCEEILLGDINLDSYINVLDVVTLVQYIIGGSELESDAQIAADINEDNSINVLDVVTLVNSILD